MIDIKTISGELLLSVPILQDAVCHEELMVSDYVALSWNSDNNEELPAGAYIEFEGERYSLLEPYKPTMVTEGEFKYAPQFHSRVSAWDKQPACVYTYESDGVTVKTREFDWTFVGSPADALHIIKQAIKNETGEEWHVKIAESLPASIEISSQTSSIKSVLASIADQCQTEYWVEKATNTLHLSKCEFGEEVALQVGSNIGVPSVMMGGNEYYTRYYALGSSRNITQGTAGVNGSVNKRLTLDPTAFPHGYKDVKGHFENGVFVSDLKLGEIFSKVVVFDDIYPSSDLEIYDVRARMKYRLDGDGKKIKIGGTDENPVYDQYSIWYFKIKDFSFNSDSLIEGLPLSVHFKSGRLSGQEFELIYHDKAKTENTNGDVGQFNVEVGDYEIKFKESSGVIIPDIAYIIPQSGDKVALYNIEMPKEYTSSAQQRLLEALDKHIEKEHSDSNTYEFSSNPVAFYESELTLSVGQKVSFVNGEKTLETRTLMVERKLDYPCEQKIRIGSDIIKGSTKELRENVESLNHNVDVLAAFNDLSKSIQDSYGRNQALVNEAISSLLGIWALDSEGNLVTDKQVIIKNNLIIEGDTSSSGEGKDTPSGGISGVRVNGVTYYDDNGDGIVDLGTISGGGGTADLSNYYTKSQSDARYLALSGGTINGDLSLNQYLRINAWAGYGSGSANAWYNGNTQMLLWENVSGMGLGSNVVIHSGNIGSYAMKWMGNDGYRDLNTFSYDAGVFGSFYSPNAPSGLNAYAVLNLPYRRNAEKPDFMAQILIPNGDDADTNMYYRTSLADSWNPWRKVISTADDGYIYGLGGYIDIQYSDEINRYGGNLHLQHRGTVAGEGTGGNYTGNVIMCANGGNVLIGTATDSGYKLDVNGDISAMSALRIGGCGTSYCGLYPNSQITSEAKPKRLWLYNEDEIAIAGTYLTIYSSANINGTLNIGGNLVVSGDVAAA